ncbi:MAG: sulfate ABC transporter substrate-binding protein [Porticoccaceae bacterium]
MKAVRRLILSRIIRAAALSLTFSAALAVADTTLLNVSYDVSRELYKDINAAFEADWKATQRGRITINQSHGGSSKQAQAIASGLQADVVTMNQSPDIDYLADNGLVATDWRQRFPHEATPYTTTTIFLVRKGNPKNIQDWHDLARDGLEVIVPNPKTSGNGRYSYLAAWGYALQTSGSEDAALAFVKDLFANVPVLDGGGRGATTTFTQRGMGDVLVTFENEAILLARELGDDKFDVVYPSLSIDASAPVAIVEKVTSKRGTEQQAKHYLDFLYSLEGQEIIARHYLRPRNAEILEKYSHHFPAIKTFKVEDTLGSWRDVGKKHFADGGIFDQVVENQ